MNIRTRVLEPEEWYLIEPLIEEGATPIDPEWGRVIGSIDTDTGKAVGFVALQLVLHAEPIVIAEEFREQGHWKDLAEFVEGYLFASGANAVYNQPTNDKAKAICEKLGYIKAEYPLYVKYYNSEKE